MYPLVVRCRGFPAQSMCSMLQALRMTEQKKSAAIKKISQKVEMGSCSVWIKTGERKSGIHNTMRLSAYYTQKELSSNE